MPNLLEMRIEGHVGDAPTFVEAKDGKKPYYRFSVAVNVGTKEMPKTVWVKVYDRSKLEYSQSKYLKKGDAVLVDGEPWANAWLKQGEAKSDLCLTTFHVLQLNWHKAEQAVSES
jgi:single-stranded DNA-binding protein